MTPGQLILKTAIVQVLLLATRIVFFRLLNIELLPILIAYYVFLAAVSIAVARRLGVVNYLEIFLTIIIWLVFSLVIDLVITREVIGGDKYLTVNFWVSYLIMPIAILIFHKKQHVAVRKGLM
ncbi:hypothetical protein IPM19_01490 [bacterium]|nr:MAG: hypothetical protein IPM19_01490 [bacterium]